MIEVLAIANIIPDCRNHLGNVCSSVLKSRRRIAISKIFIFSENLFQIEIVLVTSLLGR